MPNAVKHLYRTVGIYPDGAVEMLHCVRHAPKLIAAYAARISRSGDFSNLLRA